MVSTFWITLILIKICVKLKSSVIAFPHISSENTFQRTPQKNIYSLKQLFSRLCSMYLIQILNISGFPQFLFTPQQATTCSHWSIYINMWKVPCKAFVFGCNIFTSPIFRQTRPLQLVVVMMIMMNTLVQPRLYFGLWKTSRPASCQNLKLWMR